MKNVKVIQHSYKPFVPFEAFHTRHQRFALMVCSRRAGKTVAVVNDMVIRALKTSKIAPGVPRPFYAYVAPLLKQAKAAVWEAYLLPLAAELGAKTNAADLSMTLPNGAVIRVFGADNPDSFRGLYFDGVVLDEFGDMKSVVWTQNIRPALSDRKGWAVFIGTPRGKNAFYKMREQARNDDGARWFHMELPASKILANGGPRTGWGALTPEEVQDAKNDMDEDEFAQEYECSFDAANVGSYYGKIIRKLVEAGRVTKVPYIKAAPVHIAFDLGYTDATAAWYFQLINDELRIIDHQEWNLIDIHTIMEDVARTGYRIGEVWLPHDAKAKSLQTGKSILEQFWSRGFQPRQVPELSVTDGIQAVRDVLPYCQFDSETCYQGLEALKSYQKKYSIETASFSRTPKHDWTSHSADSFRYLCLAVASTVNWLQKPRGTENVAQEPERFDPTKHIEAIPVNRGTDVSQIGISEEEFEELEGHFSQMQYERF